MTEIALKDPTHETGQEPVMLGDLADDLGSKKGVIVSETADRILHHSEKAPSAIEAEKGVLSGILLDKEAFEIATQDGLSANYFYQPNHGVIFSAMLSLHEKGEPIDTVTVVDKLHSMQKLEQIGGAAAIADLETLFPSAAHVATYAKLVRDKASLRELISTSTNIVRSAYQQDRPVTEIIDQAEKEILALRDLSSKQGALPIQELIAAAIRHFDSLSKNGSSMTGVPSGFKDLDEITCGFQPGELIIIAGRPSMGKTAFMLNIATYAAMKANAPIAFFSLEMGADQLIQRMIGAEAQIDLSRLKRGNFEKDEYTNLLKAAADIGETNLYIDETPSLSIMELRNKARRMVRKQGAEMIIIDYLQLMSGPVNSENKATEVGEISKGLKSIARELKVPVIALSQLNRGVESRTDKRPMMSDLRESGAIEQDADIIGFLYREEYYLRDNTPEDKKGVAEVIIAKNRNGPTGSINLRFFSHITRFVDLDKDHDYVSGY